MTQFHGDNGFGGGGGFGFGPPQAPRLTVDDRFQAADNVSIGFLIWSTIDSRTTGRGFSSPARHPFWFLMITKTMFFVV